MLSPGLWIPPLSAEQIQAAFAFGEEHYGTVAQLEQSSDPFDVYVPEVQVLVTIGTAFGRIAAYAGQRLRTGLPLDGPDIENMNYMTLLQTHFFVRLLSKHKRLSIMATDIGDGNPQNMENAKVERMPNDLYSQTCNFRYPVSPITTKGFEIGVPRFVLLKFRTEFTAAQFSFDFASLH